MRSVFVIASLLLAVACDKPAAGSNKRASLNRTGGTTFEVIPSADQHQHCLIYTVSRSGLTRQMTMSGNNQSFDCIAGRPIGGHSYRVPLNEGPVRVYVFFTSQKVNAAAVSQELLEAPNRQALSAMNMRLPGNVTLETLDFTPEEDVAPEVGRVVGVDAGSPTRSEDGGAL
ncbi:MAG: hypothetical protein ACO1OB_15510 [Archangium sp.]